MRLHEGRRSSRTGVAKAHYIFDRVVRQLPWVPLYWGAASTHSINPRFRR